ncbi:MAG: TrpR family transcriptional regulator, trp operon repressor, partial [Parcubacteria group bacterium Greene0714_36]
MITDSPRQKKSYEQELNALLAKIGAFDRKLLRDFLLDLLTPAEYKELALRWQIVKMLHQGISQRRIAKNLGVGIATVSRGSRELLDPK